MHLHDPAKVVERHLREGPVAQHAGVGHEYVDAPPSIDGARRHRFHAGSVGDVAAVRDRIATAALDLLDDRMPGRAGSVSGHVVDHDARTLLCQRQRVRPAQTAAGTRDDGHAAVQ
jgi:hypothetical protein